MRRFGGCSAWTYAPTMLTGRTVGTVGLAIAGRAESFARGILQISSRISWNLLASRSTDAILYS
jgi:hypothetical protein